MINTNQKETIAVVALGNTISTIRYGVTIVWQAIKSCFGKGWWINDKPWDNKDGWQN